MSAFSPLTRQAARVWKSLAARGANRGHTSRSATAHAPCLPAIVTPEARDRWMGATARQLTPQRVEQILRSAMSGNLLAQWELFDLMEATWPRLQKNLNEIKRGVASLDWSLQAWTTGEETPSPEAMRRQQLVEELVWSMRPNPAADENDFSATIRDLLDAWGKGIAVLEIDWATSAATRSGRDQPLARPPGHLYKSKAAGRSGGPSLPQNLVGTRGSGVRQDKGHQSGAREPFGVTCGSSHAGRASGSSLPEMVIAPRCTRWVHPRHYGYPGTADWLGLNAKETGINLAAVTPSVEGFAPFPPDKFLIAIAKQKSGHPVGAALLRPLAFWWCAANFTGEWLLNFAQIFGQPIRWATYDTAKPGLLELVSEMLENMGSAGWAAMPAGTQLELKEAARSGQDNPQAIVLNLADRVCDVLVLGQTLTTDVSGSGSRALGEVHQSVRDEVIQAAAEWAAGVLNAQLLPGICRLNFGDDSACPWFMPARKQVKDAKAMAERDQILLKAGVALPRAWFYERHDVPLPAEGEETIHIPAHPAPAAKSAHPVAHA